MTKQHLSFGMVCLICCSFSHDAQSFEPAPAKTGSPVSRQQKEALAKFNGLIGEWRGVGMPKRGSTRGAWIESAKWVWDFKNGEVGIRYLISKGKLLTSAKLTFDAKSKQYQLKATFADKSSRSYSGTLAGKQLVLKSKPNKSGEVFRMTITRRSDKRTLVLHEKQLRKGGLFLRIAEVGYTRKGTSIAVAGGNGPECVVTGGKATTPVTYKGKTYYVCCSGCRQAFEDDPAGIIADYKKRLAARKAKRK
ncbi:MAG: hypothetical protein Tsb009_03150 [Planctomycetaceae bacterium]